MDKLVFMLQIIMERSINCWIDVVGTDTHHDRHIATLKQFTANGELHAILAQYPIQNKGLFYDIS